MDVLGLPARRLGTGLVAFGVVGLLLTVVMAIAWLGGLVAVADLDERLEADRQAIATALADTATLMDSTASALESTSGSLGSVGAALDDTAGLLDTLATTTADLADSLNVTILGQQPFAGLADSFAEIADELETFATHADTLATDIDGLGPDVDAVTADLRTVEASIAALAPRVEAFSGVEKMVGLVRAYALLSALLSAWLGVLAAGCVWAGRQLRRAAGPSAEGAPSETSPSG